jgi:hypothetical protein
MLRGMMHRYVKKPVEIDAIQWTGENTQEILAFCDECFSYQKHDVNILVINTLEGSMKATPMDYIIKGIKGEFYACKPHVFIMSYEQVH